MQPDKYNTLWNNVVARIKTYENIDVSQIDAFFSRLMIQAFSEGYLMLTADTEFIKKWIESHYTVVIKRALEEMYNVSFTLEIEVDPTSSSMITPLAAQQVQPISQFIPHVNQGTPEISPSTSPQTQQAFTSSQEGLTLPVDTHQTALPDEAHSMQQAGTVVPANLQQEQYLTQSDKQPKQPFTPSPYPAQHIPQHQIINYQQARQIPSQGGLTYSATGGGAPTPSTPTVSGYTFENFVIGTSNRMAYSMAVAVAEAPGQQQLNPLFIYGKSGLGKTHLLRSIQNYVHFAYPEQRTVYVDTMELVNDYTDAAISKNNKSFSQFKQRYETADVLLIDDVQGLQNKKETLNMVFQILNSMIDRGKQVVLSADRAPKNIDIDERYMSRFNMGGTCDIQPPELETKLGIIKNYLEECKVSVDEHLNISNEVQEYIAQNSSSNIRELKSAVTKVIFELRNGSRDEITINEASKLLADHFSGGAMKRLTISDIQTAVERYYGVSHSELVGRKRSANITYARQIAIYLCRTMIDIPFNSIGNEFNRDHSTVMYSFRTVEERVKESREVHEELEIIRQMILDQ